MSHPFMAAVAEELGERGIATLRYQFPYMEQGSKRPDAPKIAHATVRAAVGEARRRLPALPLFAGGKSFGGRMTSQAQAAAPLEGVRGLAFPRLSAAPGRAAIAGAGRASVRCAKFRCSSCRERVTRSPSLSELEPLCEALGPARDLEAVPEADHSFHVPARTGLKDSQVRSAMLDTLAAWIDGVIACAELTASSVASARRLATGAVGSRSAGRRTKSCAGELITSDVLKDMFLICPRFDRITSGISAAGAD